MALDRQKSAADREAEAWGIDVSLIEANLDRTPTERLEVLQQALDTIFELRKAWHHDQHKRPSSEITGKQD